MNSRPSLPGIRLDDASLPNNPALPGLIEEALNRKGLNLSFPPSIESIFETETAPRRRLHLFWSGVVALLVYNLFFLSDETVVPDLTRTMILLRLGIITPAGGVLLFFLRRPIPALARETVCVIATLVVDAGLCVPLVASRHPNVVFGHATVLLAVIFGNISLKPRFPFAVGSSIALLVGYAAILPFCRLDPHLWGFLFSTVLSATLFTLMANYSLEEEYRRGYLLTLRERLRQAGLQEENHTLSELASLDPLTNLANRREFDARLETLLREPTMLSLVMIDVDHFKGYNDIHGHQAGDKCLQMISRALQELTRGRRDIAARFGGEEFVLLLPDSDLSTACQVAERIRTSIAQLGIHHGDSPVSSVVTISAGVATWRPKSTSADLVARADEALYRAKSEGRNRVCTEGSPQPIT